jgi:hypothetical protein
MVGVASAVAFAALLLAARIEGVGLESALADPEETTGFRLVGVVSQVGVLLWTATVSVCLVTALVGSDAGDHRAAFFGASAIVAAVLLVDDFLLVHEYADDAVGFVVDFDHSRRRKNILELVVFGLYGLMVASYLRRFRAEIAASRNLTLRLAGLLLAGSLAVDMGPLDIVFDRFDIVVGAAADDVHLVVEEGFKFVGIAFVAHYFLEASREVLAELGQPVGADQVAEAGEPYPS